MKKLSPLTAALLFALAAAGEPIHYIDVDGDFNDWATVPEYTDPENDTHDTDHDGAFDVPTYVDHVDVDLLSFKFTHDEKNLYAYWRSRGVIGRTQTAAPGRREGRYYVIVTIDVDNKDITGYPLHEGGYYPTTPGYDMNMEVEYFGGAFNTGHFLNHGCRNQAELEQAFLDQAQEFVVVREGTYDFYTQWVMFDTPQGFPEEVILPSGRSLVWVLDKGPVYQGILEIALSPDGHEAEMVAPFRGFMMHPNGDPLVKPGRVMDISFSLEASGELAVGGEWASDTADPIVGYAVEAKYHHADSDNNRHISMSELLRLVQFYNLDGYHCEDPQSPSEDGFEPGPGDTQCDPHTSDYLPQDWKLGLSEMLRSIQLYNSLGYESCRDGEDGFCLIGLAR